MLQEFLAALCGFTGDIFIEKENTIVLTPNLPFVSPSEESLMNEMCILGSYYKSIDLFIQSCSSSLIDYQKSGLYKQTFSQAIKKALNDYRFCLWDIEGELLHDRTLSISHVRWRLNDYFILFPVLNNMIEIITNNNYRGCKLLDAIYKGGMPVGNVTVRKSWNNIVKQCNDILLHQITVWILKGALYDPYGEFFIRPVLVEKTGTDTEQETVPNFLDGISRMELEEAIETSVKGIVKKFQTCERNIPCSLPITLIKRIHFIGESVHLFDENRHKVIKTSLDKRIVNSSNSENSFEQLRSELCNRFGDEMKEMRKFPEFNLLKLQSVVDRVEKYMRQRMWSLLMKEHNFLDGFFSCCIKDLFLLGRGELLAEFIRESESLNLIGEEWNNMSDTNLTICFTRAARLVGLDDELDYNEDDTDVSKNHAAMRKKRGFSINDVKVITKIRKPTEEEAQDISYLVSKEKVEWNKISLTTRIPWPLQLVINEDALQKYGKLFSFLLLIRTTHGRLAHSVRHISQYHSRVLRHMQFLVSCLQYHMSVDVIEARVAQFRHEAQTNEDIEDLKMAHEKFQDQLCNETLLSGSDQLHSGITDICLKCLEYCSLLELIRKTNIEYTSINTPVHNSHEKQLYRQLDIVSRQYEDKATVMYNILNNLQSFVKAKESLARLIVKLDFNSYFSTAGATMGSQMTSMENRNTIRLHRV